MARNPFVMPGAEHPRNLAVQPFAPVHATPAMLAAARHTAAGRIPNDPQLAGLAHVAGAQGVTPGVQIRGRIDNPKRQPTTGQALRSLGSLFG